ncbi:MAG: helix-turn-helix transcriptional regulator [Dorea sp.]|nr:helix-turn-helix transcriptional regulator [Dorea sp.]
MDIGLQIKKFREQKSFSQEQLAHKIFVSRQTISNWETNKSCPDVKSLIMLSNIFNVSLDSFIKEDMKEMREIVEKETIKKFNVMSFVFLAEMIIVAVSAYPLFSIDGYIGIIIWLCLFAVALYTASKIERFKKNYDIQSYKEILAFMDGKQLTYDETQQELGKRNYQKIIFAFLAGVIALVICIIVIFICQHLLN